MTQPAPDSRQRVAHRWLGLETLKSCCNVQSLETEFSPFAGEEANPAGVSVLLTITREQEAGSGTTGNSVFGLWSCLQACPTLQCSRNSCQSDCTSGMSQALSKPQDAGPWPTLAGPGVPGAGSQPMCNLEQSGARLGRAGAVLPTGQQARPHNGRCPLCRAPLLPLGQCSPRKSKGVSAGKGQGLVLCGAA